MMGRWEGNLDSAPAMKVGQMRHLKCGSDSGIRESWWIRESAMYLWSFGR